ncbi:hypothetical protein L9F63_025865, partial [Diploptera punctata]
EGELYVLLTYFNILAIPLAFAFVWGIADVAEALVAVNRLQAFLLNEEYKPLSQVEVNNDLDTVDKKEPEKAAIAISKGSASWCETSTVCNLSLTALEGKLVAIIGQVGSGKSSLLHVILGELPLTEGNCKVNGSVSYASQDPWLFGATIRQNILFGSEFDKERYDKVLKVCGLQQDLQLLPQGDATSVGERGTSLSGGQKARINLARAIYRNADIYILDGPLSAVDSHVGKLVFDDCIKSYLKNKTRILVTHQLQYLQEADFIIVLNNGEIEAKGTYDEVFGENLYLTIFLDDKQCRTFCLKASLLSSAKTTVKRQPELQNSRLMIGARDMLYFLRANICILCGVLLLFVCSQVSTSGTDYWLSF